MAEQQTPDAAADGAAEAKKGPKTGLLVGLAVAGVALGGGLGALVLGPRIFPAAAVAADSAAADSAGAPHGDEELAGGKIFKLDNLIVNPAGSEGTRFLMTTVAFETPDDKADAKLREREIEIRDRVISILQTRTLEALTRPDARDSLKSDLMGVVAPILGPKARVRVYLPQYVIQ